MATIINTSVNVYAINGSEVEQINVPHNKDIRITGCWAEAVNCISSLQFNIYKGHPYFDKIQLRNTNIRIPDNFGGIDQFYGRVIGIEQNLTQSGEIYKTVTCEGWMAAFHDMGCDYISLDENIDNMKEMLEYVLSEYRRLNVWYSNGVQLYLSQSIILESIPLAGYTPQGKSLYEIVIDICTEYNMVCMCENTMFDIETGRETVSFMLKKANESRVLHEDSKIVMRNNLISYTERIDASDIVTRVTPYGARLYTDETAQDRVDITSVNDGSIELISESEPYGAVWKTLTYDNITDPAELKAEGQKYLEEHKNPTRVVTIAAVDPDILGDTEESGRIRAGELHPVIVPYFGIDEYMYITKVVRYIEDPSKDTFEVSTISPHKTWMTTAIDNRMIDVTNQFTAVSEASSQALKKAEEVDENAVWTDGSRVMKNLTVGNRKGDTGVNSSSFGTENVASGENSIAATSKATASEKNTIALGYLATATKQNAVAIGPYADAGGVNALAMSSGEMCQAYGPNSCVIGVGYVLASNSMAMNGGVIKSTVQRDAHNTIAVGGNIEGANNTIVLMSSWNASELITQNYAIILGNFNYAAGTNELGAPNTNSILIGNNLISNYSKKIVLGAYNEDGDNILEIGAGNSSERKNVLVITRDKKLLLNGEEITAVNPEKIQEILQEILNEIKGTANGIASLDENGQVPASQLPSSINDIIEGYYYEEKFYRESGYENEINGEEKKIYIDLPTEQLYRWADSKFTVISNNSESAINDGEGNNIVETYAKKAIYEDNSVNIGRQADTDIGNRSFACGNSVEASGVNSHAEGSNTTASGNNSHAENNQTIASAMNSHAEGLATVANGKQSHAEGRFTIATGSNQHVQGKYNEEDTEDEFAHIIGGGTSDANRKNIHTVDWSGNAIYAGNVTGHDTDGNEYSLIEHMQNVSNPHGVTAEQIGLGEENIINALGYFPIDSAKIANNLITTEEGYVLNAIQGKVLYDLITKISANAKARGYTFQNVASGVEVTTNYNMLNNLFCIYGKGFITPTSSGWIDIITDNRFDTINSKAHYFSLTTRRTDTGSLVNSHGEILRENNYLRLRANFPTANIQYQIIFDVSVYLENV